MTGTGVVRAGAALVLAPLLGLSGLAGCGDDGSGDGGSGAPAGGAPVTGEPDPGDLEVDAPDGWQTVPMPSLGFGLAVPGSWEAVVLDEDGLDVLSRADPAVPGFTASATAAATAGAVLYAAGPGPGSATGDGGAGGSGGPVDDLKVFADTDGEVDDLDGLRSYVDDMVASGVGEAIGDATDVDGTEHPTVEVRFETTGTLRPHGDGGGDGGEDGDGGSSGGTTGHGLQRSVLLPSGLVYSFIVTSETEGYLDELAPRLLDTVDVTGERQGVS